MHCWVTVTAPLASYDSLISESLCFFLKLHVLQSEPGHLPEVGQLGHLPGHLRDLQSLRILQQEHPQLCVQRLVQIYIVKRISSISVHLAFHNLSYSNMNLARQSVQAPLGGCYTGLVTLAASRQFTLKIFSISTASKTSSGGSTTASPEVSAVIHYETWNVKIKVA